MWQGTKGGPQPTMCKELSSQSNALQSAILPKACVQANLATVEP